MKTKPVTGMAKGAKMSMSKLGKASPTLMSDKGMGKTYKPGKDTPRISSCG